MQRGQVLVKTLSTGSNENYVYDTSGRLVSISVYDSNVILIAYVAYGYNNGDQVVSETATGHFGNYSKAKYYNAAGRLISEVKTGQNPSTDVYTYDGRACRTSKTINGANTVYTYDAIGRIATANGVAYTYDNAGNLLSKGTETFQYFLTSHSHLCRFVVLIANSNLRLSTISSLTYHHRMVEFSVLLASFLSLNLRAEKGKTTW